MEGERGPQSESQLGGAGHHVTICVWYIPAKSFSAATGR
jgi:hypothetical protein